MFKFKDFRIGTKLATLILVFALGLIGFSAYAFYTINYIDLDSPVYEDIQEDNALIADVLPPPLYIVEFYLVSLQIFHEAESGKTELVNSLIEEAAQLQKEYELRHEFWLQNIASSENPEILELLVVDSYQPVNEYFEAFNNKFLPAIRANDLETAHHIYDDELVPLYKQHQAIVDEIIARQQAELVEDEVEIRALVNGQKNFLTILSFLTILASLAVAVYVSQSITRPMKQLTTVAEQIAAGNLRNKAPIESKDETGILSTAFNNMTSTLEATIENIENTVKERTSDLERTSKLSEKRSVQLLTISEISKLINTEQNVEQLLPLITSLVSERFGFYHAGIFLLDPNKRFAILQATNSIGGQKMLARGHKLELGTGLVGFVATTGQPRIALDVGTDAFFFNNPDLPNTRSEMALPLRYADEIIGVLDVQSTISNAFGQDDVEVLATLADQIAIAINNTRSLEQAQKALAEAQTAVQKSTIQSWQILKPKDIKTGLTIKDSKIKQLEVPIESNYIKEALETGKTVVSNEKQSQIAIPLRLRGKVIGVVNIGMQNQNFLSEDVVEIAEAVAERLSLAIENTTLLQAAEYRANLERITTNITSRIGSSIRFDNILQTAAQELSRALGGSDVLVQIEPAALELSAGNE
jgi:GAF domain-containing protein/HAMP domain-containing protein